MNLIIDIGNTRTKIGVFDTDKMVFADVLTNTRYILEVVAQYNINRAILSSVGNNSELETLLTNTGLPIVNFNHSTPVPLDNLYKTPETLGVDRLAVAVGGYALYPGQNVLIIDCGTAITYEFVNDKGEYLGGNISPGLEMRFKALNHYTAKLPLLEPKVEEKILGTDTQSAIRNGVQQGIVNEIEGYIKYYSSELNFFKTILTGGDAIFFEKQIKSSIFADSNILLSGLNKILQYNAENNYL